MMHRYFRSLAAMSPKGKKGRTEAAYGYGKMLLSLMSRQPGAVVAVFDHGTHNFRNYVLSTYKKEYGAVPAELAPQIELAQHLCGLLGVEVYSVNEVEADDVIGSLAHKATRGGKEVVIVSTDRDFFQLPHDGTQLLAPGVENLGLGEKPTLYDENKAGEWIREKYGVGFDPRLMGDVKAIAGSTAKGIPGVKGIGEKGAARLVHQYGSVERIVKLTHRMASGKGSLREKLESGLVDLIKSKELTEIRTNVRLNQFKVEDCNGLKPYDAKVASAFLTMLGLKDLARKSRKLSEQIEWAKKREKSVLTPRERETFYGEVEAKPEPLFV